MKNLYLSILLVLVSGVHVCFAQNNTSSPYSYYGLGELNQVGFGQASGFGGTSLSFRNRSYLSVDNPAALTAIDSLKFIFNVGVSSKISNLNQSGNSDVLYDNNLSGVSLGFRVSHKIASAVSLVPYTSMGYNISSLEKVNGSSDYYQRILSGSGGLNQFVISNGIALTKKLSLGVNAIYLFGNNSANETITIGNTYNITVEKLISKGIYGNIGMQYQDSFTKDWEITIGAKFQPKVQVAAKKKENVSNSGSGNVIDNDVLNKGSFDVPMTYGFGLGFTKNKQLWLGADYLHEKWSETKIFKKSSALADRNRYSVGMNYIANDGYATKFLKKLTYRFGAFYDTGYIVNDIDRIKSKGVSFGLGIPMAQNKGAINLSFEFGQMGTADNNNVREDYGRVTIEMSLFETWFLKRKYQ
ncbi:hypothetical protein [Labilibaculum sp.]|uniref:OmpP1/FadL family transporter n=1 Tax=Labilibaculum sp. TaxID=2060723 RepID=UPI002AA7E87E|nr:hypothetical protein [Labilibaculum sp.]MBN2598814.1 hypothetical protein [Marinifilaceae bacterium]